MSSNQIPKGGFIFDIWGGGGWFWGEGTFLDFLVSSPPLWPRGGCEGAVQSKTRPIWTALPVPGLHWGREGRASTPPPYPLWHKEK